MPYPFSKELRFIKITLINSLYTPNIVGGAELLVQLLAETLVTAGHEAVVLSLTPQATPRTDSVNGVRVYYLPLKNLYWPFGENAPEGLKPFWHLYDSYNPQMARAVGQVLDSEKPSLVHTHNLTGFSVAVWQEVKKRRLPTVHTLHDYHLLCPRSTMFRGGENCARQCLDCRALSLPKLSQSNHVDAVVGVSRFILERHLSHGYFRTTPMKDVVLNAYPNALQNARQEERVARSEPLRVGFLGRIVPTKGVENLLQACESLPPDRLELLIGGAGQADYIEYLQSRYVLPNCTYLGYVEPKQFFSQIDLLVVPSLWHEPCPLVVIEALACGRPVIGSNRGGIPELISEGEMGFVVEPDQPGMLRGAIERFLREPALAKKMRHACFEKAESFLPSRMTEAYTDIYRRALKRATTERSS